MRLEDQLTDIFDKPSTAKWSKTIQYADRMPSGASLSSCAVAAINYLTGQSASSVISSTTATVSGSNASVFVQAGTAGQRYLITYTATLSDGSILVDKLLMTVI